MAKTSMINKQQKEPKFSTRAYTRCRLCGRPHSCLLYTSSRVFKNKKMSGHYGVDRVTTQNMSVVRVDAERNLLLVRGAVPGPKGGTLSIIHICAGARRSGCKPFR